MKHVGEILGDWVVDMKRAAAEQEASVRRRAGDRDALTFASEEHGPEIVKLLPRNFTFNDYVSTFSEPTTGQAKRRLTLCAKCPEHGGACASEYEQKRGRSPRWDRDNGLHMDWCPKWSLYLVREKLSLIGVEQRMLGYRFESYTPTTEKQIAAKVECQNYAGQFARGKPKPSSTLVLSGKGTGVGKTHLAISVVADVIARNQIQNALFAYVPDFMERVRKSFDDPSERGLIEKASRTDLLVLDDLAAQRTTDWVREQLDRIANSRWSRGLPTIITTNVNVDAMSKTLGARAASRVFGDAFNVVVDGNDQRQR